MQHRLAAKIVIGIMAVAAFQGASWAAPQAAAQQESPYKDQLEYDMSNAAMKEADPQKKLDKLKEWEQKYPDSKLKDQRTLMQAQGLLGIAIAAYGKPGPPEVLDAGQKAAQQIVDNLDNYFSAGVKPAGATDAQWADARKTFDLQSHLALGWVAMTKKNDSAAESEFKKVLTIDPTLAQVSYYLGTVIIRQKKVERYSEALYDISRSLSVTGPNALPPAAATPYDAYLKRAYAGYHGDESGLTELKQQAAGAALPPAGFHIKSIAEIENEKFANEAEFNKAHPDIALWRSIRTALKADGADAYFATVKGSEIPPAEIKMFKAKVVTVNDKDIVVNVDNAGGDATLKFEKSVNAKAIEVGAAIEFKAIVEAYSKEPYMLTLSVADPKEDIAGLPANAFSAAPPAKRPAGPARGARRPITKK